MASKEQFEYDKAKYLFLLGCVVGVGVTSVVALVVATLVMK